MMAEDHVSWTLCEYCQNELNGACYAIRTVYQQIEQKGGRKLYRDVHVCHMYDRTTAEHKRHMEREAEWYQRLKAVDFNVDRL